MTEKKLYLLQFAAVHMAELCAGSPKVVRCQVVEFQTECTVPDHVPDDVFGYAVTPNGSVATDCLKTRPVVTDAAVSHLSMAFFTPAWHRNCADVVALAD